MDNGQAPFFAFVDAAITSVRQCDDLRKLRSPERAAEATRAIETRKRMRVTLALAASVLLFISLGSGGWLYRLRQEADRQTAEADAQRAHAREMQALAEERDAQRQTADLARADAERAEAKAEERAYVASLAASAADLQRNDSHSISRARLTG